MADVVLRYFDIPGRAEVTRLLLVYGDVPFVDKRIPKAMYPHLKPSLDLPFGSLPTLEVAGETYGCSLAIARYAATRVGLYPTHNPLLAYHVDRLATVINDVMVALFMILYMDGCPVLRSKRLRRARRRVPQLLQHLEDEASEGGCFFSVLTWVDVYLFDLIHNVLLRYCSVLRIPFDKYAKLQAIYHTVRGNSNVAAYLKRTDGAQHFRPRRVTTG
ncbi:glutathione S-transferase [Achlya hypogyna]|uniref:Glutathione S-transferase n=1 Tax=Achlya hypogyna TaxID=1202772 RepID=A0A1V9YMG6_ACHHY|nr:glutathione S-transferase [Achlya hypogyna]